jgi:ABC-type transport system involved in multi-copper enzyme maturation permease subunit
MKFLAMLKDSLRETLDVKLFHVLVGLSVLVVLGVFSITYKPLGMDSQVEDAVKRFSFSDQENTWIFQLLRQIAQEEEAANVIPETHIKDFQRTDGGPADKPWLGDYKFTVSLRLIVLDEGSPFARRPSSEELSPEKIAKNLKKIEAAKKRLTLEFMRRLCVHTFDILEGVNVEEGEADDQPNVVNFTVTSHGSTIKTSKGWFYQPHLFFGLLPVPEDVVKLLAFFFNGFNPESLKTLGDMVSFFGDRIVGAIGALFTMFLSIIMTASFIPNMLAKGSVDLLLVKPIHRTTLFLYKFVGSLLFMFLNTTIIMVGIWLAMGVQTGLWTHALLLYIPVLTLQFAIFYSVAALISVLTRSTVLAILCAFMWWGFLFIIGWSHYAFIELPRANASPGYKNHWAYRGYDGLKAALPRYKDLDWLATRSTRTELNEMMYPDGPIRAKNAKAIEEGYGNYDWGTAILVTFVWIGLFLALACLRFATKDY